MFACLSCFGRSEAQESVHASSPPPGGSPGITVHKPQIHGAVPFKSTGSFTDLRSVPTRTASVSRPGPSGASFVEYSAKSSGMVSPFSIMQPTASPRSGIVAPSPGLQGTVVGRILSHARMSLSPAEAPSIASCKSTLGSGTPQGHSIDIVAQTTARYIDQFTQKVPSVPIDLTESSQLEERPTLPTRELRSNPNHSLSSDVLDLVSKAPSIVTSDLGRTVWPANSQRASTTMEGVPSSSAFAAAGLQEPERTHSMTASSASPPASSPIRSPTVGGEGFTTRRAAVVKRRSLIDLGMQNRWGAEEVSSAGTALNHDVGLQRGMSFTGDGERQPGAWTNGGSRLYSLRTPSHGGVRFSKHDVEVTGLPVAALAHRRRAATPGGMDSYTSLIDPALIGLSNSVSTAGTPADSPHSRYERQAGSSADQVSVPVSPGHITPSLSYADTPPTSGLGSRRSTQDLKGSSTLPPLQVSLNGDSLSLWSQPNNTLGVLDPGCDFVEEPDSTFEDIHEEEQVYRQIKYKYDGFSMLGGEANGGNGWGRALKPSGSALERSMTMRAGSHAPLARTTSVLESKTTSASGATSYDGATKKAVGVRALFPRKPGVKAASFK